MLINSFSFPFLSPVGTSIELEELKWILAVLFSWHLWDGEHIQIEISLKRRCSLPWHLACSWGWTWLVHQFSLEIVARRCEYVKSSALMWGHAVHLEVIDGEGCSIYCSLALSGVLLFGFVLNMCQWTVNGTEYNNLILLSARKHCDWDMFQQKRWYFIFSYTLFLSCSLNIINI